MSLRASYPERIIIYMNTTKNKDSSKFDIKIPDGILKCENYEDFYLNVIQFNTFHNFYNVIDGYNNNFNLIVNNFIIIQCQIPEGKISIKTIMSYINNDALLQQHIKVVYDSNTNKFEFQKISDNILQLELVNCHPLLGFNRDETLLFIPCKSSISINVMSITNVFLHPESGYDLNINDGNMDNHNSDIVKSNSIILSLPVNKLYNNMIVYNNEDSGNSFILNVINNNI